MKSPGVEQQTGAEDEMEIIRSVLPPSEMRGDVHAGSRSADKKENPRGVVVDGVRLDEVVESIPPETEGSYRSDEAAHAVYRLRIGSACAYYRSNVQRLFPYVFFSFLAFVLMSGGWFVGGTLWSEPESETVFTSDRSAAVITEHSLRAHADRQPLDGSTDSPEVLPPITEASELIVERAPDGGTSAGQAPPNRGTGDSPVPESIAREGVAEEGTGGPTGANDPAVASELLATSIRHFNAGDYEASIRVGNDAWAADPMNARIVNHVAASYLQTGEWILAESWSRRALEIDSAFNGAWTNLGAALLRQGRVEEAEEIYFRMVREDPRNWKALAALAGVWTEMGRFDESVHAHIQTVRMAPDRPELHYNLGVALAGERRIPEARDAFLAYLKLSAGSDPVREAKIRSWLSRLP